MEDKLEKFIRGHRSEMDDKEPGGDLWSKVERDLLPKKHEKSMVKTHVYWRAAAVLLMLVTSWLVYEKVNHGFQDVSSDKIMAEHTELMEAEGFYTTLIHQKKEEIDQWDNQFGFGAEFKNEIEMLDSMYLVLKHEMKYGNTEEMADAMILNLQVRVEILNQQIKILESINNGQKNEKVSL